MSNKKHITPEEAALIGAQAALEKMEELRRADEKARREQKKQRYDDRIANVKLLLRNYRALKNHAENAVGEKLVEVTPFEILEDMMQGRDIDVKIESVLESAARTAVMVEHINTMLDLFRADCLFNHKDSPEWVRRWEVIEALYISDVGSSVVELADRYQTVAQNIYNDLNIAYERITALMFGIDGLSAQRSRRGRKAKGAGE